MKRRAFTLVELLIVIVVIGILAVAMLLASGGASSSARAATIISDLRSLKSAAMMLYMDSRDEFESPAPPVLDVAMLSRYMNTPPPDLAERYSFADRENMWFIDCSLENFPAGVRESLAGKAKAVGLLRGGTRVLDDWYLGGDQCSYLVRR